MAVPKFRAESRASRSRDEHVTVLTGGGRMGVAVPLPLQSLPSERGLNHLLSPKLFEIRNGYEMKRMYVRFAKKIKNEANVPPNYAGTTWLTESDLASGDSASPRMSSATNSGAASRRTRSMDAVESTTSLPPCRFSPLLAPSKSLENRRQQAPCGMGEWRLTESLPRLGTGRSLAALG
jgi:hypothetical protein